MIEKDTNDKKEEKKQQKIAMEVQKEYTVSNICETTEIEIEEVAIDGICGVY
jgi:mycofactocin precursor